MYSTCTVSPLENEGLVARIIERHPEMELVDATPRLGAPGLAVSRPFSSWGRQILTEIYLCDACSCHEILRVKTAG